MSQTAMTVSKAGPVWGYRWVAILTAALLLLQPILIGQYLARPEHSGWKDAHSMIGDALTIIVLIQVILAFLARRTYGMGLFGHNVALLVLVIIQSGLGHAASDGHATPKAIHIPLGVLLFGMGITAPLMAFFDLRHQRRIE